MPYPQGDVAHQVRFRIRSREPEMTGRLLPRLDGRDEILVHLLAAPVFLRRDRVRLRRLPQEWPAARRQAALGPDPHRPPGSAVHFLGHGLAAIVVVYRQWRMDAPLGPLETN